MSKKMRLNQVLSMCIRFGLLVLSVVISCGAHAQQTSESESDSDSYTETGVNPFQTKISDVPNETVDPYSGIVQLSQQDILIPGNAGLDIVVNRAYTSRKRLLLRDLGGPLGSGWKFHFGRLSGSDLDVCLENGDSDPLTINNVSVEMNSGSKDVLVKSTIPGVPGLISKNNLRVQCSATTEEDNFILAPDGTKYTHKRIGQSAVVTRIDDTHGNWIRIEYDQNGHPLELYRKEESEESLTNGGSETPVLSFQYATKSVRVGANIESKKLLESISYGSKIWQYNVEKFTNPSSEFLEEFHLTEVVRPDEKKWQFEYFPNDVQTLTTSVGSEIISHLDSFPGGGSVKRVTYPNGGTLDYTYQAVQFRKNASYLNYFVVKTKTLTDPVSAQTATWDYQFTPGSDPTYPDANIHNGPNGTVTLDEPLALDVTTITSPYGVVKYRHFGNHVSTYEIQVTGGQQDVFVFWPRALLGTLARKEVYSTTGALIEAKVYNWGFRTISDEQYTPGDRFETAANQPISIHDTNTRAPLLLSESIVYDLAWNGDSYGTTTYEEYDTFGNPTRIRESSNIGGKQDTIIEYEYANNLDKWIVGLPTRKTAKLEGTSNEAVTTNEYDTQTGNLLKSTHLGISVQYTYYPNGELETVTDANGVTTRFEDYVRGIATKQYNGAGTFSIPPGPDGVIGAENTILRTVNPSGTIASITDANGNETKYTYDQFDRLIAIDYPINLDLTLEYTNFGSAGGATSVCVECATITYSRGPYSRTDFFDGFGRAIGQLERNNLTAGTGVGRVFKTRHDLLGRTVFESLPSSEDGVSYEYDALNRLVKRTNSDDTFSTLSYTRSAAVRSTDELGNVIDRLYDDPGSTVLYSNLSQELRNGDGGIGTQFNRDVLGNIVSIFHGDFENGGLNGFWRYYEYNDQFQLVREDNGEVPDPNKEYTYDPAGNVKTSTVIANLGSNIVTTLQYDSRYRVKNILSSDTNTPTLTYDYDDNGNVIRTVNDIVEKNYQYDANDNLITEQLNIGAPHNQNFSHSYTYNDLDQVSTIEYPSGLIVDLNPDVLGRQTKAGIFADDIQYFPSSHLKSYTLGNNKTVNIDLDQRLFVQRINTDSLVDLTYSYDSVGNVKAITDSLDNARSVSIPNDGYDAIYRLKKASGSWGNVEYSYSDGRPMDFATRTINGQVETYVYDAASNGNLSEFFPAGSTQVSDVSYQYSYDKLGNISQRKKRIFSFPLFSEFTLEETNFQYDANSRLLRAGDKQYLYDAGGMQVAEIGARARDRKFNFYNQAETLVFEYDRSKCMTTDYIRIASTQIAKSDDTDEQDTDGDQLSDCHEGNIGNAINDPSDGAVDTDGDGVEDREEINVLKTDPYEVDTDGDGANDNVDVFPNDPTRTGLESDADGDGVPDSLDAFPNDPTESKDTDSDGVGDNADAFPNDPTETTDSDGDGVGDNADAFPNDANETVDTDGDGVGDNADAFPNDPSETRDSDNDGVGNNADAFPFDPNETTDTDADGVGDNADVFPNDPNESLDTDSDGVGDNADAFPNDPTETVDSDGDGVGDNSDAFPNDPTQSVDDNGNGIGDFLDSDHDGLYDEVEWVLGTDLQNDDGEALADYDNDGFSNRQEAIAGTDLNDASAVPELGALLWTRKIRLTDKKDISKVQGMALGNTGYLYTGSGDILGRSGSVKARTSVPLASSPSIAQDGLAYYGNGCSLVSVNEEGDQTEFANYPVPANVSLRGGCIFSGPSMNSDASLFVVSTSNQDEPNFPSFITFDENGSLLTPLSPSVFWISDHLIGPDNTIYTIPTDAYSFTSFNANGTLNWIAGAAQTNTFSIDRDGFLFFSDGAEIKKINKEDGSTVFSHPYQDFGGSNVKNGNKNLLIGDDNTLYFTASNDVDIFGYLNAKLAKLDTQTGAAEVLDCDIDQLGFIGENGFIYGFVTERTGGSVALKACDASGNEVWQAPLSSAYSFGLLDIGIQTSNSYAIDEDGTLYLSSLETDPGTGEAIIVVSAFITDSQGLADTPWPKFRHDNQNTGHQPGGVDSDGDGVIDDEDAFPNDPTETTDSDGDGVGDNSDAFPNDPNETQDSDGDGVGDNADAFPNDPTQSVDENGNGIGDFLDSDHDGLYDEVEILIGTDRYNDGGEALADYDNDGFSNRQESAAQTDLLDANSFPELGQLILDVPLIVNEEYLGYGQEGIALSDQGFIYDSSGNIYYRDGALKVSSDVPVKGVPVLGKSGSAYYSFSPDSEAAALNQDQGACQLHRMSSDGEVDSFQTYLFTNSSGQCFQYPATVNDDETLIVLPTGGGYGQETADYIGYDSNGDVAMEYFLSTSGYDLTGRGSIGPDNSFYAFPEDAYRVSRFDENGAELWEASSALFPFEYAIDRSGTLHMLTGNNDVTAQKINPDGSVVNYSEIYSPQSSGNHGVLINNNNDVFYFYNYNNGADSKSYKVEYQTNQVQEFACSGSSLSFIGQNGLIYAASRQRNDGSTSAATILRACDTNGNEAWQAELAESVGAGAYNFAVDRDGTLYVSTSEYNTVENSYRYRLKAFVTDSQGLANSPWPKAWHDNRNSGHQPGEQLVLSEPAQILSPAEGETLQSDVLTLRWEDVQADSYLIQVGSQSGLSDITEMTVSGSQTEAVVNLPGDNSLIYVRLISQFDDQSVYDEISLYALGSSNLVNLAQGKPANQSSTYAAGSASRAVDGNTSGVWTEGSVTHTNNADQSLWQVDLGAHASIDSISLHNRTDCCADRLSNFYVLVSDTPFGSRSLSELLTDSTVYNSFHQGLNEASLDIVLGNVTGRYVRVQLQDAGVLSLAEVQVFGDVLADQPSAAAQILSPLEGEKLQSGVLTLTWEDVQADNYLIQIGTQRGLSDIAEVSVAGSQTQAVVNFARMHPLFYVRLVSQFGSQSSYDEIFLRLASLAEGKPAEQSSTYAAGAANRAVDGNTNGVWAQGSVTHTSNSTQPWWQVDLESNASIENIIVHNRTDCCADSLSNFYVLVSDTPFGDRSLDELLNDASIENHFHAGTLNGMNVSIPFAGAIGRYVRVQLQGNGPLSLAEVEVIGTPVATTPVGDGLTQDNPATSCKAILDASPLAMTGVYWLLRNDSSSAFQAYCDMTTDGGGWTMVVAQYETSRTNDWNQGIQAVYNPTLTTKQGFVFNSNEIPAHTQTGFGQDLKPTDIDYVDFQYSTGDILLTGLIGLKTGNLYYIYRNRLNSYGSGDPRPDGNLITIPQWNDALMFDVHPGLYTWGFAPNNPERLNRLSGASYGGVRRTQSNDDFAWTIWVR